MEARKWTLKQKIEGMPTVEDFVIATEILNSTLEDGEILTKAEWWTVDPYMRERANHLSVGEMMLGGQVARVIKSCHPQFPQGSQVIFVDYLTPTLWEYVACQGCNVIGFAGTDDKVAWLKTLGFDQAYNYKSVDLVETFQSNVKQGIDCYFDNVGGEFSYHTIRNMNTGGRIALCGAISCYNEDASKPYFVPFVYMNLIYKGIKMEGFLVYQFAKEWLDGISQLRDWIIEGKLQVEETVSEGFETMPQAFIDVLSGKNTGKQVIKAL
ncbi:unnamed protein product [Allacma fusca]|uniref:Uncharacterized protein n=1 Tax=Allacma fusca TaxID=39272 RepID=A0A8J2NTD2_9HEXA|nr:unnamed protein product [Allacma fusca]